MRAGGQQTGGDDVPKLRTGGENEKAQRTDPRFGALRLT
jgi:hypothetical protein